MIKNFVPRLYQETIFASAINKNTLVVLPTGLGKTNIFLMLAAQRLKQYPSSKILLIGPTKPLADQYLEVFKEHFEIDERKMAVFTGMVSPGRRAELWGECKIFFSTPQGLENDIISKRINLEDVSLLGFDEAHRAVGDYSYVFVAKQYFKLAKFPRIIALTASPGSDMGKIEEVCKNLFIENIEIRTDSDPDVKPYIQELDMDYVQVNLPPPMVEVQEYLKNFLKSRLEKLKSLGLLQGKNVDFTNKTDLLAMQSELRARAASGENDFVLWNGISVLAEIMKMQHALELLETQGIVSLNSYLQKIHQEGFNSKTKAVHNIVKDPNFRSCLLKAEKLFDDKTEHPKLIELQKIVKNKLMENPQLKMIVFNQYRDNALDIREKLNTIEGAKAEIFVGQVKKGETGLSQKEQKAALDRFREGLFNVLISTSVGEEGLDVPNVDLVIFYEPIPSAIRHIQRRGRTGRHEKGSVIVLMAKDTRDQGYRWSAHHKEKKMFKNLEKLRKDINLFISENRNPKLAEFSSEKTDKSANPVIYADYREKASGVIKALLDMNADIKLESLENADYILSSRVGVEYKTVPDFVDSIVDGRLLQQIKGMKQAFYRPLILIEGVENLYSMRNIHPNAVQGMLATIAVSYGIPILWSRNPAESASLLCIIARREQEDSTKEFSAHTQKYDMSLKEWQEYIVASLPGIGGALSKPLLKQFKTVRGIMNASHDKLEKVDKIGPKKAERIRDVLDREYDG